MQQVYTPTMLYKTLRPKRGTTEKAQRLRIVRTWAENRLWLQLRNRQCNGLKFRRQVPVGPFIADFACVEQKLLIELDGEVHEQTKDCDRGRDAYLKRHGFTVLRFSNDEVYEDTDKVVAVIKSHCAPHPDPLPRGEGPL